MESIWHGALHIFMFSWTPILRMSTVYDINVGMIYISFVLFMIIGTKAYEIFYMYLKSDGYLCLAAALLVEVFAFSNIYIVDSFWLRFFMLSIVNGISGFYQPLNSKIKSKIISERHRALLMGLMRVPLNLYVICILIFCRKVNPVDVILILLFSYA